MRAPALAVVLVLAAACSSTSTSATGGDATGATVTFATGAGSVAVAGIEVADTEDERARGLMGRATLGTDEGMLFVFDEPSDGSFWMKGTLIPLSIAFWGDDGAIDTIVEMTPCEADTCETYPAAAPFRYALEMNAGWFADHGVEVGDRADVELDTA